MLVGVLPQHRNKGLLAMIFNDLIPRYQSAGFKYAESNAELETNTSMQSQWAAFQNELTKRRRIYKKHL